MVQEFKVLRMAWKWGQECGLVPDRALPRAKVQVDRTHFVANHRTPTEDEVARVLEHLQGDYRLAVELMATTGARVGEVCSLRGRDFDPATGDLTLRGKTGARAYPLPPHVAEKLRGRTRGDVPLLQLAKRAPTECVRSHLTRACRAASVERFTPPHGLRRMVVDLMAERGVDVATAASLTGHSPEVMLRHYRQVSDEARRAAVARAGLGNVCREGQVITGPWQHESVTKSGNGTAN